MIFILYTPHTYDRANRNDFCSRHCACVRGSQLLETYSKKPRGLAEKNDWEYVRIEMWQRRRHIEDGKKKCTVCSKMMHTCRHQLIPFSQNLLKSFLLGFLLTYNIRVCSHLYKRIIISMQLQRWMDERNKKKVENILHFCSALLCSITIVIYQNRWQQK